MMRRLLCGLVIGTWSTAASAQTGTPLDRERVDREQSVSSAVRFPVALGAATRVDAMDASTPIRSIRFEGTDVPEGVAAAAQEHLGQPATTKTLQALVEAMSRAYSLSDVALFTVVVPEQDLSTGVLRVLVAEGYIETVVLTGEVEGRELALVRRYADRLIEERPTSRRTLERYLSLIQDIPGMTVRSRTELGRAPGAVRLVLTLDYKRHSLGFSFDSRTSDVVRDGQVQATASAYSLLREGDETQLVGAAAVNFQDLRYIGLVHSTPVGVDGVRLAFSAGGLQTAPQDGLSGEAHTLGMTLSYPVLRSYRRDLTTSLSLDGMDSKNAAFGSVIANEQARAVRGALGYSQAWESRKLWSRFTASQGLDILDASVSPMVGDAEFFKLNGSAGIDQRLGQRTTLRLSAIQQWTDDPLPAVERFSLGGQDFGRAFEPGHLSADRGLAGFAELAWRPMASGAFLRTEIYGFTDAATASLLPRPGFSGRDFELSSAGVGVRAAWRDKAMLELELARPLERPFPDNEDDWRVWVGWRLSLQPND